MRKLSVHPAAEILPPMCEADFQRLKEDIDLRRLKEPIWLYQGQILDGRNRHRACVELGIKPSTQEYKGNDPEDFVLSVNLQRRHLNESQRAMVAATLATSKWGGARTKAQDYALSRGHVAEKCNISERLVDMAAALLKAQEVGEVIRELPELVRSGGVRLFKAAQIADLPLDEQRRIVTQIRDHRGAMSGLSSSERWQRRFEAMVVRPRRLTEQLSRFVNNADRAEMLTPESSSHLIDECRNAAEAFRRIAERLSFTSGVGNAKSVPSAETAKSEQA